MSQQDDHLGGRLPLLAPADLEGAQKALYDQIQSDLVAWAEKAGFQGQTSDGRVIGPFNPFLHSPGITPGFLKWMQADSANSRLTKRVHEIVILSVGAVWRSPYELYSHSVVARNAGVPASAIEDIVAGRAAAGLSAEEELAQTFATRLVVDRSVDDVLYRAAVAAFGEGGVVDMTYLIGMYLMTCAMLNVFEIPAPENKAAGSGSKRLQHPIRI